jgi:hypothetical protein
VHSRLKRAEVVALLDCGATENFMNLQYTKYLHLPIKKYAKERRLFNVDGTENKAGNIQYYVDLDTQTGTHHTKMRYLLSDLGDNKLILGYPWFANAQPKIDWKHGWLDSSQLPIVLRSADAAKIRFTPQTKNVPRTRQETDHIYIACVTIRHDDPTDTSAIPPHFQCFTKVFSEEASHQYPPARLWDHAIELQDDAPASLPRQLIKLSQPEQEELRKFLKEHLECGTIRPSKSHYTASFFFIKKKDGKLQPVQDYRPINKWTIRNHYPLPLIPQLINCLRGCSLFTKFDIRWGYNNVQIKDGDQWKAAFLTNEGLFEPMVMFFGLTNSPATFQTMMNTIFREEIAQGWLTVYMDDMAIHTSTKADETERQHLNRHRDLVTKILTKLEEHQLFLKLEKCAFEQSSIEFLGVTVSRDTVQMDDKKVDKVSTWPTPTTQTEVRKFLGFTGYYRYFIQNYSAIAKPLLELTHKTTTWHWEHAQQTAFETLRNKMVSKPVLRQPDFTKRFYVHTNASAYGVGAILLQEGEAPTGDPPKPSKPKLHPIAYYSATFTPTERNYDIYERELLAVIKALTNWRPYLIWTETPFIVRTDHANLLHWKEPQNLNRRMARWHAVLQDYNFKIEHVPGKDHQAADALSRPLVLPKFG